MLINFKNWVSEILFNNLLLVFVIMCFFLVIGLNFLVILGFIENLFNWVS